MKLRYVDKANHPMLGPVKKQKQDEFTLSFISKPGELNTMFGKSIVLLLENECH